MLDTLLAGQEALIADYQQKALKTEDAQKCNLWSQTLTELITGYFKLINKDQTVMALSQADLDLVLTSIKDNGTATAKIAELEAAIASTRAELEAFQADDVIEDAAFQAKIDELNASLEADEAQLSTIKAALVEAGTPVVEG